MGRFVFEGLEKKKEVPEIEEQIAISSKH